MFIIDFDDTLFDTHAFKEARQEAVKDLGVSDELYQQSYHEAYNNSSGINTYNNHRHAEVLEKYGFDKELVVSSLDKLNTRAKHFLFPDAINLLEYLKNFNQKLILLSLGESSFQKMKIDGAGIAKYFDEVFTVDDTKEHVIEKIINEFSKEKDIWFINDKIEETKKILEHFPQLKPLLKKSPQFAHEEYCSSKMPCFDTLTQIQKYVEQQLR